MPSVATGTSLGLYWTGCTTSGGDYVCLSTMDNVSVTAYSNWHRCVCTCEFAIYGTETLELLSDTGRITSSGCIYLVDSITANVTTGTEPYWSMRMRMVPDASNTELQNLMLSTAEGDQPSGQILQYIASTATSNYFSAQPRELTEEEIEAAEQRRRTRELAAEREAMRRQAASHKAINLLWEHLSPAQKRSLKKKGWFDVVSKCGVKYRLLYTLHGNVLRMGSQNKVEQAFCGHMGANIPIADTLLAQKFLLRHNPGKYEASADKVNYEHTLWCQPQKSFSDEILYALNSPAPTLPPEELMLA